MENLSDWVREQTALLDPSGDWEPDTRAALARQHARVEAASSRRYGWLWAAATALGCAALFLLPEARALAQQFWQFLTVGRVAVIRVNPWPAGVAAPHINLVGIPIPPQRVRNLEEARWRAGFDPRLPAPGVLSSSPELSVVFPMSMVTVVKNADLRQALERAGAGDQSLPAAWDGATLALHSSRIVIAEWPDILLAQSLPLTVTAPPGVDFPAWSALMLRILGVRASQAKELAERMATVPVWLLPVDSEMGRGKTIREVSLRGGPGTLIEDSDKKGERVTVVWSVSDRVYLLSGRISGELAIATANAVP
ncbi:MAG: hypothetical protein M3O35_20330 [Acidobacteriota bacterium]|nr:hypothetical protein [Acidobacteriota bacterium]